MATSIDLSTVLATAALVGADTPAYTALYSEIKALFGTEDQATLQAALAAAQADNDAGHADLQKILGEAAKNS